LRDAKAAAVRRQDREKHAISSGGALDTARVLREFLKKSILLTVSAAISFAADLPDGPGKAATIRVCSKCHAIEKAVSLRQDEDGWTDTISKMVKMGAQGSDDDFNAVLAYLTKNFGPEVAPPININKADSVDLESSLVLTRTEAAALIRYRTEKGPFKTIDDLRNIPGLDFQKIERQKSRITF
jgi:competence protein ComEA